MRKVSKAVRQTRSESHASGASHAFRIKVLGVEVSFRTNSSVMAGVVVMATVVICMAGLIWGMGASAAQRQPSTSQQRVEAVVEAKAFKALVEEARYIVRQ